MKWLLVMVGLIMLSGCQKENLVAINLLETAGPFRGYITTQILVGPACATYFTTGTITVYDQNGTLLGNMTFQPPGDIYSGYFRCVVPDISKNYYLLLKSPLGSSCYSRSTTNILDIIYSNKFLIKSDDFVPTNYHFENLEYQAYPRQFVVVP